MYTILIVYFSSLKLLLDFTKVNEKKTFLVKIYLMYLIQLCKFIHVNVINKLPTVLLTNY